MLELLSRPDFWRQLSRSKTLIHRMTKLYRLTAAARTKILKKRTMTSRPGLTAMWLKNLMRSTTAAATRIATQAWVKLMGTKMMRTEKVVKGKARLCGRTKERRVNLWRSGRARRPGPHRPGRGADLEKEA